MQNSKRPHFGPCATFLYFWKYYILCKYKRHDPDTVPDEMCYKNTGYITIQIIIYKACNSLSTVYTENFLF